MDTCYYRNQPFNVPLPEHPLSGTNVCMHKLTASRHTVVCRAAQEAGTPYP